MTPLEKLWACVPRRAGEAFDWPAVSAALPGDVLGRLAAVPQDPVWHGEGDAATHTRLVCEALMALPAYWAQVESVRRALLLAALLHDVGKIPCTRVEEGKIVSPHHGSTGAHMARELLWTDMALSGTQEAQRLRETVCALVRWHMAPVHMLSQEQPERTLRQMAADGLLLPDFTVEALCLLSEADVRGRIAPDVPELLESVQLCRELVAEAGCLHGPVPFADEYTQRAYFRGSQVWAGQSLFDPTWGTVTLMAGLPGTGKDTWIAAHLPGVPVVSLDALREAMDVSPTEEQGRVAQAALEQARVHLRAKQPFVWNATNLTEPMRMKLVTLCENYGASVRIVYLETPWEENQRRNEGRESCVPPKAVRRMLGKLAPPRAFEAKRVDWLLV